MPSETFFRLSQPKQERILDAIKEEIARAPYENFSIGNVIRQSGISRGSFYQYFRNKDDIYTYLISIYQTLIFNHMQETLRNNGGDFFAMVDASFRYAVRMLCYKDSKAFRHNLFCNMHLYELLWQSEEYTEEARGYIEQLFACINREQLRVRNDEELSALFRICAITALKDAAGVFMANDNEQTVLDNFSPKFMLLRNTFRKD